MTKNKNKKQEPVRESTFGEHASQIPTADDDVTKDADTEEAEAEQPTESAEASQPGDEEENVVSETEVAFAESESPASETKESKSDPEWNRKKEMIKKHYPHIPDQNLATPEAAMDELDMDEKEMYDMIETLT